MAIDACMEGYIDSSKSWKRRQSRRFGSAYIKYGGWVVVGGWVVDGWWSMDGLG